jgi:cell division protein ZapA (FtsZ GTPase activity inhibitor)
MSIERVNIAGRDLTIRSNQSREHIDQVVALLNDRITSTKSVIPDSAEAMLFVALSLMEELVSTSKKLEHIQQTAHQKLSHILNELDHFDKNSKARRTQPEDQPISFHK